MILPVEGNRSTVDAASSSASITRAFNANSATPSIVASGRSSPWASRRSRSATTARRRITRTWVPEPGEVGSLEGLTFVGPDAADRDRLPLGEASRAVEALERLVVLAVDGVPPLEALGDVRREEPGHGVNSPGGGGGLRDRSRSWTAGVPADDGHGSRLKFRHKSRWMSGGGDPVTVRGRDGVVYGTFTAEGSRLGVVRPTCNGGWRGEAGLWAMRTTRAAEPGEDDEGPGGDLHAA
jgi:hypothetical protein